MSHVTSIARGARKFVVDNSPMILTGMAVAGLVTTAVLAAKASPRAWMDIQHAESERTEPLTNVEKVKLTYHYFIPAAVAGSLTIGAIIMAQSINSRRQAAFISAYTIAEKRYREYQEKVRETVGEQKEKDIHDEVSAKIARENPKSERNVVITGQGHILTYDPMSDRYFPADYPILQQAEIDTNYQILDEGYASLNDFYSRCGLTGIPLGEEVGWTSDKKFELRITTMQSEDNEPCFTIAFSTQPIRNYYRFNR
ncbi:hypothetical protein QCN36_gp41 [Arthrobacter phage CastorTray]|uniref:Uncharacterized protein n=1 Tax=Arthrobacter phage CastorTray TaxID=2859632 RepID=A0AAE8BFF0_9CAUD|nr:hypothetical protein QCN36_gp41 [Arthrobacter phage CastorTray]QYC55029.1 hypothetical protein SEA_CASTORTRAY_41 [Arthrobacter phage CastorTray]